MPVLRDCQRQKLINFLCSLQGHYALPQFLALIFPNDVATERVEFHMEAGKPKMGAKVTVHYDIFPT